jgi:hypothetical protein
MAASARSTKKTQTLNDVIRERSSSHDGSAHRVRGARDADLARRRAPSRAMDARAARVRRVSTRRAAFTRAEP